MDQLTAVLKLILEKANYLAATVLTALILAFAQSHGYLIALPAEIVQIINIAAVFSAMLLVTGAVSWLWRQLRARYRAS